MNESFSIGEDGHKNLKLQHKVRGAAGHSTGGCGDKEKAVVWLQRAEGRVRGGFLEVATSEQRQEGWTE